MSEQSITNKFFNEVKGLAEDFHSLREENAALKLENERLRGLIGGTRDLLIWSDSKQCWEVRFEKLELPKKNS